MKYISSWANGIIFSIVVATLIEMLLPNGNSKKYIKTILGLYVMFAIISPVIECFGKNTYSFNNVLNEFKVKTEYKAFSENSISDTNSSIEPIYKKKIEEDVKEKLKAKGYDVTITALSVNLVNGENYGEINQINIKVNKKIKDENISKIEKVEISISESEKKENINSYEIEEIRKYISEEYGVKKSRINIF